MAVNHVSDLQHNHGNKSLYYKYAAVSISLRDGGLINPYSPLVDGSGSSPPLHVYRSMHSNQMRFTSGLQITKIDPKIYLVIFRKP